MPSTKPKGLAELAEVGLGRFNPSMSRYKGRVSAKSNERKFPHVVELPVPPNGFGTKFDIIELFHVNAGIEMHRGAGRHEDGGDFVRFCFADPAHAGAFQAMFGGK